MLAIGWILMPEPKFLRIEELSLGFMPKAVDVCYTVIKDLNTQEVAILFVEQRTQRLPESSDSTIVLESGKTVWKGRTYELLF